MSTDFDKNQLTIKMDKSLSVFKKDLKTDKKMPINQLSTITVPEPRSISIQVWDKSNVALIDSAIKKSNLGVNPQIDGQILRIHIPQLTEERRLELVKTLKTLGEKGKVSIRNIRRESNDNIKKLLSEKKISEDESKNFEKEIQKVTDMNIEKIDKILSDKEKEILKQ